MGTVGDGIAAFGAVGGALGDAGGGVVGVWAEPHKGRADALRRTANTRIATAIFLTTGPPFPSGGICSKPKPDYFVPVPRLAQCNGQKNAINGVPTSTTSNERGSPSFQ
jgi:hypothetical protein